MRQLPRNDEGFTLIELLVVIICLGILSAVSLPSLLNQANKAKQSEAKTYVGTLNRTQQAYFLERNRFAGDMESLANPIPAETDNYSYSFSPVAPEESETPSRSVVNYGASKAASLKSYAGMVALVAVPETGEGTTTASLCEANTPGATPAQKPTEPPLTGGVFQPTCDESTTKL